MGNGTATERRGTGRQHGVVVQGPRLHFAIRYYTDYDSYTWSRFYTTTDYGEIGLGGSIRGDRAATEAMESGYVYIFKDSGLVAAYEVRGGQYQGVKVTEEDASHDEKVGETQPYMTIADFFVEPHPEPHYVVVSAIPLSAERLFTSDHAIAKDPSRRGVNIAISRYKLRKADEDSRSGPEILADYRSGESSPDLSSYDFQRTFFGKWEGFTLLVPDVAREARRRNRRYRQRISRYLTWLNDERRTQEAYVIQAVTSILNQDRDNEDYIDQDRYREWKERDTEQFRSHSFPVYYAIRSLVQWLEDELFKELLRDYSFGTDAHQQAGAEIYGDAIRDIHFRQEGAEYLEQEYDDTDSYFNHSTRLLDLKPEYADKEWFTNSYVEIRKWNNVVFAFMEEFIPVMVAKEQSKTLDLLQRFVREKVGVTLQKVSVKPVAHFGETVEVLDVRQALQTASRFPDTKTGKGLVTFVEVGNVGIAIWGLTKSASASEYVKNGLNMIGASLDFSSSNWLVKGAIERKLAERSGVITAGRLITGAVVVSGLIDCVLGIWEASAAYDAGEIDVMIGWSIFALGGAIIGVGAGVKMFGANVTVGSGGTLAEAGAVVILAGLVVEGIGLAVVFFCNNDEIEDWLTTCMVGTRPARKSVRRQIQDLNDILCKFEVDAEFEDTRYARRNSTEVTFVITPRVITEQSRLTFTRLSAVAEARWGEYLDPSAEDADLVSGAAGSRKPVIDLGNPRGATVKREDGRISEIRTSIRYPMDIDKVSGEIQLDVRNGTLQGYKRSFSVEAGW